MIRAILLEYSPCCGGSHLGVGLGQHGGQRPGQDAEDHPSGQLRQTSEELLVVRVRPLWSTQQPLSTTRQSTDHATSSAETQQEAEKVTQQEAEKVTQQEAEKGTQQEAEKVTAETVTAVEDSPGRRTRQWSGW